MLINLNGRYKLGYAPLFRVHRRIILLPLTQSKYFDFSSLTCKRILSMNKLRLILINLIGPYI